MVANEGHVEFTPRAIRDAVDCAVYLGLEAGDAVAQRFLTAPEATVFDLARMPHLGSVRRLSSERLDGLRQWPVSDFAAYLIFYIPRANGLTVLRVLHGARDVDAILDAEEPES